MIGFVIFYGVAGRTFLGIYQGPAYEFELVDMAIAVVLGVVAAIVMLVFVGVILVARTAAELVPNPYVRGVTGGGIVGLIACALPLTRVLVSLSSALSPRARQRLAAVAVSYLRAPISMTFIAAIAVSLDPTTTAPIAVSVVTSYLVVSFIRFAITRRRETDAEPGDTSAAVTS